MYGQTFIKEVPSASVALGLRVRYLGNLESFKVEEQVALWAFMFVQGATFEHLLAGDDFAGLKLGVFIKVLTNLKLEDLVRFLAGSLLLLLEEEPFFKIAAPIITVLLVAELIWILEGLTEDPFLASELLVGFM